MSQALLQPEGRAPSSSSTSTRTGSPNFSWGESRRFCTTASQPVRQLVYLPVERGLAFLQRPHCDHEVIADLRVDEGLVDPPHDEVALFRRGLRASPEMVVVSLPEVCTWPTVLVFAVGRGIRDLPRPAESGSQPNTHVPDTDRFLGDRAKPFAGPGRGGCPSWYPVDVGLFDAEL